MNVTILCDASFCPTYHVAGYGYWIASERGKLGGGGAVIEEVLDTNAAEMMAVCNAIWHAIGAGLIHEGDYLLIQTDSTAAIDRFEAKKAVNITEQQNRVIAYFDKICRRLKLQVRFRHVKAHTNVTDRRSLANQSCDKRAKAAMREARKTKIAAPYIHHIEEMLHEHR